ncbi:C2 NT-type domain-containing protein [Heracleum sosnowskyi]|uniref:C2 NT-type domain-containing protein n=1 Tax=Heracleum sosnowskyi TaxID=360622 RepID=A0AAD8HM87_9APIA|nr:C2 NT-type domain-containing protein [Heracleum sosnowskyi]
MRGGPSVELEYQIHLQEIRPWPPSQSLKSLRSALIQWEHNHKYSGSSNPVVAPNVGDGKIQFNYTFRLPVTLFRDGDAFHKNCLELNLFEPRRDKTVKGQLLATAIIDLAEYVSVKEAITITSPMNCKRVLSNKAPPVLFLKIQRVQRNRASSFTRDGQLRNASLDRNGSVSALMNEEYAEIASSTDADVSFHSSTIVPSSAVLSEGDPSPEKKENISKTRKEGIKDLNVQRVLASKERLQETTIKPADERHDSLKESQSFSSSTDLSSDSESQENMHSTISNSREPSLMLIEKTIDTRSVQSSTSSIAYEGRDEELVIYRSTNEKGNLVEHILENTEIFADFDTIQNGNAVDSNCENQQESGTERLILDENLQHPIVDEQLTRSPPNDSRMQSISESDFHSDSRENVRSNIDGITHVKSFRSPTESRRSNGVAKSSQFVGKGKDVEHGSSVNKVHAPARRLSRLYLHACKENSSSRIASAARSIISGLVLVAKACGNDVPRLTFWLSNSVVLRAVLSQAYANQTLSLSGDPCKATTSQKGKIEKLPALKWRDSYSSLSKETGGALHQNVEKWEDFNTFTSALQSIETWIFSRIVESIWWQILTPHMQSFASNDMNTILNTTSSLENIDQGNFSLELWKKALGDAYERICPIRAGRHECGCLHVISGLIMEQCLSRLDVAMFNAILRESADDIPTDPVSDPIADLKVLPIPSGKSSFGAGAQLRTAIGIWSRWLTDRYGLDVEDPTKDRNKQEDNDVTRRQDSDKSLKSFDLLHALSDLMMLPKDMLLSKSIRKEVCPRFSTTIIRRILNNFAPDEFCPDQIPDVVLEALQSEDPTEYGEDSIQTVPCRADAILYLPLSATSVANIIGDSGSRSQLTRTGSLVLRKSYTSDDELDELESASCINSFRPSSASTKPSWMISKEDGSNNGNIRYQLLREDLLKTLDGDVITGVTVVDGGWDHIIEEIFGISPGKQLVGGRLQLSWLTKCFPPLSNNSSDVELRRYMQSYMLQLNAGFLFTDKSGGMIHCMYIPLIRDFQVFGTLDWGATVLSYLYREMCKCKSCNIGTEENAGCLLLLQLWAWTRFPTIAPIPRGPSLDNSDIWGNHLSPYGMR